MKRTTRTLLSTFALSAALGAAGAAFAQMGQDDHGPASMKSVVRLGKAPVSKDVLQVHIPRPKEVKLENGLTVMVLERHDLPTVSISLWVESGALSDPKDLPGLAEFTAEMLHEGTSSRTSAQIDAAVENLGASLSSSAGFGSDISEAGASGLAVDLDKLLGLLSDVVLHPTFPDSELAKYKVRKLAGLEEERSDPDFLARERFFQALYGAFPASVTSPTTASIQRADRKALSEFHRRMYIPNNAILGIAGDVDAGAAIAAAKKFFGDWKSGAIEKPQRPAVENPPPRVVLVDRPGSVQTSLTVGDVTIPRTNPDFIPLLVVNRVLGEGSTSRLFLDLREEKGYTYGAYSRLEPAPYPGPWVAETEVRTAVTDGALHEILYQIQRIRDEKTPSLELEESKRAIVARFALSLENTELLLSRWMQVKYFGLPDDYWDKYPQVVASVDAAKIQEIARKYIDPSHLQIVCVGDGKSIKPALEKYGKLEEYDAEGKPVKH